MCGICGFATNKYIDKENLIAMNDTLTHRGPNDSGIYLEKVKNLYIGLGQKRLSILDLSPAGHQPMFSSDQNIAVVFNGEIYNFIEIKKILEELGYKFQSTCDTEVIIYAYKEWGINCTKKFNGMFALAIYDRPKDVIYLARDRMGKKPLYFYFHDGDFVFSSELKPIMKFKYFIKELAEESLYQYLIYQYVPTPKSIFKDVYKLYPGSYLMYQNNNYKIENFWNIVDTYCKSKYIDLMSEEEYVDEIDTLLTSSIEYRMISDVPLGAFFSGGVDSSLVTAIMSKLSNSPINTFSIGFCEEDFNEAPYAREAAKYLGTNHHELYVSPKDIIDVIPRLVDYYDEPFADSSAIPSYLVSKLTRHHVTVSLTGDGGDELFCGYEKYGLFNKLLNFYKFPYFIRKPAFFILSKLLNKDRGVQKYVQKDKHDFLNLYREVISIYSKNLVNKLINKDSYAYDFDLFSKTFHDSYNAKGSITESIMLVDVKTYLLDDILTKVDRASMAVSLEARAPFLDYRVVEFSQLVPLRIRYKNNICKYPLKKLLERYMPKSLFERPKRGFSIPIKHWFRKDLTYLIDHYLNNKRICEEGFFDKDCVNKIIKRHIVQKQDNTGIIWALLMFEMWFEKYMR